VCSYTGRPFDLCLDSLQAVCQLNRYTCRDCTGPVLLTASVHLAMASPNALVQEVVRAFYFGWYRELVDELPPLANGFIAPREAAGLGVRLKTGLESRPDATVRVSTL